MGTRGLFTLFDMVNNTYYFYYINHDSLMILREIRGKFAAAKSISAIYRIISKAVEAGYFEIPSEAQSYKPKSHAECWPFKEYTMILEINNQTSEIVSESWTIEPIMETMETGFEKAKKQRGAIKRYNPKNGEPVKVKKTKAETSDEAPKKRGRPRLSEEEKAERKAAKAEKAKAIRAAKKAEKAEKAKTETSDEAPKKRGRPRLSEEEKAERKAAKAEKAKAMRAAKKAEKAKMETSDEAPKKRGRPRLSEEEKAERKAAKAEKAKAMRAAKKAEKAVKVEPVQTMYDAVHGWSPTTGQDKKSVSFSDEEPIVYFVPGHAEEPRWGSWAADGIRERMEADRVKREHPPASFQGMDMPGSDPSDPDYSPLTI